MFSSQIYRFKLGLTSNLVQQAAAEAAEKRAQDQWPAWFRFGGLGSVVDAEKMGIFWFGDLAEGNKYPPLEKKLRNGWWKWFPNLSWSCEVVKPVPGPIEVWKVRSRLGWRFHSFVQNLGEKDQLSDFAVLYGTVPDSQTIPFILGGLHGAYSSIDFESI